MRYRRSGRTAVSSDRCAPRGAAAIPGQLRRSRLDLRQAIADPARRADLVSDRDAYDDEPLAAAHCVQPALSDEPLRMGTPEEVLRPGGLRYLCGGAHPQLTEIPRACARSMVGDESCASSTTPGHCRSMRRRLKHGHISDSPATTPCSVGRLPRGADEG